METMAAPLPYSLPIYARHLNRSHLPLLFFPQNVISAVRREEETTEATEAEGGAPKALG